MPRTSLSKDDWLAAGFRYLARTGPTSVQINPIAKELGATKGSFYWHFKDIAEFKSALLQTWKEKAATEIINQVMQETDPQARLDALVTAASQPAPDLFGGRSIEPSMRAWALSDPEVRAALKEIDAARLAFLTTVLNEAGLTDPNLPGLCYGAFIGLDDLTSKNIADIGDGLARLIALIRNAPENA